MSLPPYLIRCRTGTEGVSTQFASSPFETLPVGPSSSVCSPSVFSDHPTARSHLHHAGIIRLWRRHIAVLSTVLCGLNYEDDPSILSGA